MSRKLTPEQEEEADRIFADWRRAKNAEEEALVNFGEMELSDRARLEHRIMAMLDGNWTRRKVLRDRIGGHYATEDVNRALDALVRSGDVEIKGTPGSRGDAALMVRHLVE